LNQLEEEFEWKREGERIVFKEVILLHPLYKDGICQTSLSLSKQNMLPCLN
jgi:hypothetical protein